MATNSFPVNPVLSAIAIGYRNRDIDMIADDVLPRIPKGGRVFNYTKYSAADAYTVPNTLVGRKGEPNQVESGGVLVQGACLDYGLDDIVPNDEIEAWEAMTKPAVGGPVSPLMKSTSLVTGLVVLDREIRAANIVFNAASYAAANKVVLSGTSQWSDQTNSNPVDAILAGLDIPLYRPNVLTFGQAAWTKLRQHPKLVQGVYGTAQTGGAVTRQQAADFFEVKKIVVGAGFVNTARKGQAVNMQRVWGKHCAALFVSEDLADADQPTFGFTAQFGDRVAGSIPQPKMGLRGSEQVRVGESVVEIVAANDAGFFWQDCVG